MINKWFSNWRIRLLISCKLKRSWSSAAFQIAEITIFTLHREDEYISVNTVAVVPGATEALSGGDDMEVALTKTGPRSQNKNIMSPKVFKWRIVQGNAGLLRNYSSHTSAINQVPWPFAFPFPEAVPMQRGLSICRCDLLLRCNNEGGHRMAGPGRFQSLGMGFKELSQL